MEEMKSEPLDGPDCNVLEHGRCGEEIEKTVLASHSERTIEVTSDSGVAIQRRANDDADYDNDNDDEDDCETQLMVEIKSEPLDVPDYNVLEHGRSGKDSEEPVLASQSERRIEVTNEPGVALQRNVYNDGNYDDGDNDDDDDDVGKTSLMVEIKSEPLDVPDYNVLERDRSGKDSEHPVLASESETTIEVTSELGVGLQRGIYDENDNDDDDDYAEGVTGKINDVDDGKTYETCIHHLEDDVEPDSEADTPTRAHRELRALRCEVLDMMGNSANKDKPYQCHFCNVEPFKRVCTFLQHVAMHTGAGPITEPYQCRKCSKTLRCLQKWMKHTRERLYKCTHEGCNKNFITKSNLESHRKVHKEREKYPCGLCGAILGSKQALLKHTKLKHEGIKDHICRFCGYGFVLKGHCQRHEKTHTK